MTSKTQQEIINDYLNKGRRGKAFTGNTATRKKGVIRKFLQFCAENGYPIGSGGRTATDVVTKKEVAIPTSVDLEKVPILPIEMKQFIRTDVPQYTETRREFKRMKVHTNCGRPLLLRGPKGIGKTLLIEKFCEKNTISLVRLDCSENTKIYDLMGKFLMIGDQTVFALGIIPTAIYVANNSPNKQAILDLEELGSLTGGMQKVLNQLLDYRKSCFVAGINKNFGLEKNAKLLVVATTNPSHYGGVHELNEDLSSRFGILDMRYPNERREKKILNTKDIEEQVVNNMVVLAKETRAAEISGTVDYALSPRDLDMFFDLVRAYTAEGLNGIKYAMEEAIHGKFESDLHKKWIQQRINSIFENAPSLSDDDEDSDDLKKKEDSS